MVTKMKIWPIVLLALIAAWTLTALPIDLAGADGHTEDGRWVGDVFISFDKAHPTVPFIETSPGDDLPPTVLANAPAADPRPGRYETSEYMMGSVAVAVIMMESNGETDPNLEDWTEKEEEVALAAVNSALKKWESWYPYKVAPLSFTTQIYRKVPTRFEPMSSEETIVAGRWVDDAMVALGYKPRGQLDFLNDLRKQKMTDWAFMIFMLDCCERTGSDFKSSAPGKRALGYASLGGPLLVVPNKSIYSLEDLIAHEVGHIFYATDEYDGKSQTSGYLGATETEHSGGLMDTLSRYPHVTRVFLSQGTKFQVGWRDTDNNGIPDILDTTPSVTLRIADRVDPGQLKVTGSVAEMPYPHRNP